ncbi:MAG: transposase [Candidatus Binatia bacterium]
MPRVARIAPAGFIFHVLNRGNARGQIFEHERDYEAFERVMTESADRIAIRILAYCIMPNHWHMVLWPTREGELGQFVQRLTTTHVRRWHLYRQSVGTGHLYQGTFKSFPIQDDDHFLTVCRYVEQNPLRAGLVSRTEDWRWSSMGSLRTGKSVRAIPPISEWPVPRPSNWLQFVNQTMTSNELDGLRSSAQRGQPYGNETWKTLIAKRLGLDSTLRPRGRPRKNSL